MLYFFQIAIPIPIPDKSLEDAGSLRPGELLMLVLTLSVILGLLRFIRIERRDQNAATTKIVEDHSTAMTKKDSEFAEALKETNNTLMSINDRNHQESAKAGGECDENNLQMVKGTAVVAEMARDVKELCQMMTQSQVAQQRMLEDQQRLLHDQRGIMQTTKSLAEAVLQHVVTEKSKPDIHTHTHEIITQPKVIEGG